MNSLPEQFKTEEPIWDILWMDSSPNITFEAFVGEEKLRISGVAVTWEAVTWEAVPISGNQEVHVAPWVEEPQLFWIKCCMDTCLINKGNSQAAWLHPKQNWHLSPVEEWLGCCVSGVGQEFQVKSVDKN